MPDGERRPSQRWRALAEGGSAAVGLCAFALFAHRLGPLRVVSFVGLGGAACAIILSLRRAESPLDFIGLRRWSLGVGAWAAVGAILGLALGVACRVGYGRSALPASMAPFVLVAVLIGTTEELVYRGCIQGMVRPWGGTAAVLFAAWAHTAYKTTLFLLPSTDAPVNFLFLALATAAVGIVLGGLRELSRSVLPPILLHAVFDIIVYGDRLEAPWWVWS